METQFPHLKNPHIIKNRAMMKTRYKIAIWTVVAVAGSAMLGGSLWVWLIGLLVGRLLIRLLFTLAHWRLSSLFLLMLLSSEDYFGY